MPLPLVLPGAPQGHPLVEQAVVPNLGGLADDNAAAMVNDQPPANGGPRVDFDTRFIPGMLGNPAGQEIPMVQVQPVGRPVPQQGVDAGVEEKNLQLIPGRRVPALIGGQQAAQASQVHHASLLAGPGGNKNASRTEVREATNRGSTLIYHSRGP